MNKKSKQSLEEVKAYHKRLRAAWRVAELEAKKERTFGQLDVPPKRATRLGPITRGSKAAFGKNLRCPGGARNEATSGRMVAMIKQIAAVETGCIVATPQVERRLLNSARNANTTTP